MKKIAIVAALLFSLLSFVPAFAQGAVNPLADACKGSSAQSSTVCTDERRNRSNDRIMGKDGILMTIARTLSIVVGIASVIVIIIGGFKYVLSGGDSNGVASAKNTILYALVGLAVALLAQIIVAVFVGNLN